MSWRECRSMIVTPVSYDFQDTSHPPCFVCRRRWKDTPWAVCHCGDVFQNPLSLGLLFPHGRTVDTRADQHLSWTSWSVQWRQHSPLAQRVYWSLESGVSHRHRSPPKWEVEPKTWGRRGGTDGGPAGEVDHGAGGHGWRWWVSEERFTTSLMCGFTRIN